MSSNQVFNLIRSENLSNTAVNGILFEWDTDGWLHVHGTPDRGSSGGVTSAKTPIHLDAGEYVISAEVEAGGLGKYSYVAVWLTDDSQNIGLIYSSIGYCALSVTKPVDIYLWVGFAPASTVDYRMRLMLVEGDTPAAWAPAEGETLAGGGALMSANLLEGVKPKLASGATESDGIISIAANTGSERNVVEYAIPGQSALSANQTCHIGVSLRTASGGNEWTSVVVEYADSAGNANGVSNVTSATGDGAWHRHELSVVVPSGMHVVGIHFNQDASGTAIDFANPTLSYGSPVPLATSAHTPYATQDHVAAEYATKAALKVTSDAVTAEVEERGKLAGRVGTLESTTGTHTSKLQQLAASITSLVKGESTYTDPDGKSATSGIYSLVTQTRDSVTALFGQYTKTADMQSQIATAKSQATSAANSATDSKLASYTKTADLASTAAVKDAKKAGTDAASAASAAQSTANTAKSAASAAQSTADTAKSNAATAQSTADAAKSAASKAQSTADAAKGTADGLATMIRQDADGVTVGKSADGKTYATGRTRMTADAFQVLDKAGNVLSSFGKNLIELGKNSADATISMLAGLVKILARNDGSNTVASISSGFLSIDSTWQTTMRAGKETSGAHVEGYAAAIASVTGKRGSARLYCTQGDGSRITANNAFTVLPDRYDLSQPEYLAAALLGTGGGGSGVTHSQEGVPVTSSLDTCGPGVFSYDASTASRPTGYGTCVCIRAGGGDWLFQLALPTVGDPLWRRNINGGGWSSWWTITSQ